MSGGVSEGYDVVVVGAGSAGATLAARLSEDAGRSVLLLEAGPDNDTAHTPEGVRSTNMFRALLEPGRLWYQLVATRAPGQEPTIYARGRGAGGSSAVNAMGAIRGTPDDYDRWADELGCPGWGWPAMLDAFLGVEDDVDYGGDAMHGRGGPIPLRRVPFDELPPFDLAVRAALMDFGFPENDDYHERGATGISRFAQTHRDGKRVSTNDAYLEPARSRPNLEIRGDALVDRVLFDGKRAVGVRLAGGDEIATRDVIVSAGAIHSPAILLRSGIDALPIGANLKDHAATPGFEVALTPEGRMPSSDAPLFGSLLRFTSGLAEAGPNDLQLVWFNGVGPTDDTIAGARLIGAVMRVFSSGVVRLASDDPRVDPVVDFNMLADDRDRTRLHGVVEQMIELVRHPAVEAITEDVVALDVPLAALDTGDAIDAWIDRTVSDYVHAAGTCRMGRPGDPAAVVDTECRVIGYEGVRVCDASVMPDLPKANTHLTTVAIAEHLAAKLHR
jgi:choline dehydrogenase-like flavoprotein